MALTVKQLNGDASLLLSFEPIIPFPGQEPFRVVLDPWIARLPHQVPSKTSSEVCREEKYISSLQEIPEPDLIIISQERPGHCSEATLKQLARTNTKTIILAEPAAAKLIRSWKYFSDDKVISLERWEDPRLAGRESIKRVRVPPHTLGGGAGEVTVALVTQKRDLKGVHSTIGITYRPPPSRSLPFYRPLLTPPPSSPVHDAAPRLPSPTFMTPNPMTFSATTHDERTAIYSPPTPPASPPVQSLRSVRSTATLSPHARDRTVSVIFSPHGISYRSLQAYATTHLVTEAALPLTALLHCFNAVSQPWWLGGNVSAGMPVGQEIASALGAQAWISTHDGEKLFHGLAGKTLRTKKYKRDEVKQRLDHFSSLQAQGRAKKPAGRTEILVLAAGEEVALTSEGIWEPDSVARPRTASKLP